MQNTKAIGYQTENNYFHEPIELDLYDAEVKVFQKTILSLCVLVDIRLIFIWEDSSLMAHHQPTTNQSI